MCTAGLMTGAMGGMSSPAPTYSGPSYDLALKGYIPSLRIKESRFVKPPKEQGETNYYQRVKAAEAAWRASSDFVAREDTATWRARQKSERQAYIDAWQTANPGKDPSSVMLSGSGPGGDRVANKMKQKTAKRVTRSARGGRSALRIGA